MITIRTAIKLGLALFVALVALGASPVLIAVGIAVYALGVLFFIPDHSPVPPTPAVAEPAPTKHAEPEHEAEPEPIPDHLLPPARIAEPLPVTPLPVVLSVPERVRNWLAPMQPFADRMRATMDKAVAALRINYADKHRHADPLLTDEQDRLCSVAASAKARHGRIIEVAIREALADQERFDVWTEPAFEVSHTADGMFIGGNEARLRESETPYPTLPSEINRHVQVDLIVFDNVTKIIRAYEIKRGTSELGSYTQRQTANNSTAVKMHLRSYAAQRGIQAADAESFLISYYGKKMPGSKIDTLTRADLDEHFGAPIVAQIDEATAAFKMYLQAILAGRATHVTELESVA